MTTKTLCWECRRATGGCAWSKSFEPVSGWIALPTKINNNAARYDGRQTVSYHVINCPEYEKG